MDQELQFLISTLYGNKLNEKQLSNIISMWNSNQNGYLDLLRKQAASKMPAGTNKVNPVVALKVMNQVAGNAPKIGLSSYAFDKNAGKAVNDMSDITNFNDAFRKARQGGHKTFFWKKTKANPSGMFSTDLKPEGYDGSPIVNDDRVFADYDQTDLPIFTGDTSLSITPDTNLPIIPILGTTDLPIFTGKDPITIPEVAAEQITGTANKVAGRKYGEGQKNANLYFGRKGMYKKGGSVNKVHYFSQGGTAQNSQANAFMKAVLNGDPKAIGQLVQAANQGNTEATQLIQTILQEEQKGNAQVAKAASVIKQLAQGAVSAKWGSKLQYMKGLKYGKGGKTKSCPACEQQKVEMKKCGGKKAKKHFFGGEFDVNDKNPMRMSNGTNIVGIINRERFKNASTRGLSQTVYDSTGRPVVQKDKTSNGGEREIYYNIPTPIKRKGLFGPRHIMRNDTVYISGTPEMFENAPNMSTTEKKNQAYRFALGMD